MIFYPDKSDNFRPIRKKDLKITLLSIKIAEICRNQSKIKIFTFSQWKGSFSHPDESYFAPKKEDKKDNACRNHPILHIYNFFNIFRIYFERFRVVLSILNLNDFSRELLLYLNTRLGHWHAWIIVTGSVFLIFTLSQITICEDKGRQK